MEVLKGWVRSFVLITTFFTRIPLPVSFAVKEEEFHRGIYFMPLIGGIIGLLLWGAGEALSRFSPMLRGVLMWLYYLIITGGLHMDGLADLADGIFSNRQGEELRAIIKDSRIGVFAGLSLISAALLSVALFSEISGKALLLGPLWSRSCALLIMGYGVYPNGENGLGKGFVEKVKARDGWVGILFAAAITFIYFDTALLLFFLPILLLSLWMPRWMKKRLGGVTGDGVGFSIEVFQCLAYFTAYIYYQGLYIQ